MIRAAAFLLALSLSSIAASAAERVVIGYVDLMDDPRHEDRIGFGGIPLEVRGRPYDGAKLAMEDLAMVGRALGVEFVLATARAKHPADLIGEVGKLHSAHGANFILIDATADVLAEAARSTRAGDVLLFNVSAKADALRGKDCMPQLMHLIPGVGMQTDALVQFIVARKWRDVLVLEGPAARDADTVLALEHSAKRFGARIVAKRPFVLGSDPRERDQNNLALLTGGAAYDVVFVADDSGEFARFLPYQTLSPRLVIGDAGLTAEAWHWTWDRDGGPNLSRRFRRSAQRPMRGEDWAAWLGVKSIVEAVMRTKSTDFSTVAAYLRGSDFRVDGSKGQALSFRPWDNQLRQPIQLATRDAVVVQAPLPQFLHRSENLDTLGADLPDSACQLPPRAR